MVPKVGCPHGNRVAIERIRVSRVSQECLQFRSGGFTRIQQGMHDLVNVAGTRPVDKKQSIYLWIAASAAPPRNDEFKKIPLTEDVEH